MIAKAGLVALATVAAFGSVSVAIARPDNAARVMTGFVSHTVCSKVFVSRLDAERVYAEMMQATAGAWLIGWGFDVKVDRARGEVQTTLFGAAKARAQFYRGLGCMLDHGGNPAWAAAANIPTVATSAEPPLVETRDPAIAAALERAFAEDGSTRKVTKAVVVMKDGRIVAERYAPDHGTDTPILGFSATKSVINALAGILVREGRLKLDAPAPIAQWQAAKRSARRHHGQPSHAPHRRAGVRLIADGLARQRVGAGEPDEVSRARHGGVRGGSRTSKLRRAARGTITTATPCCSRG